jgi:hypothetical protein
MTTSYRPEGDVLAVRRRPEAHWRLTRTASGRIRPELVWTVPAKVPAPDPAPAQDLTSGAPSASHASGTSGTAVIPSGRISPEGRAEATTRRPTGGLRR